MTLAQVCAAIDFIAKYEADHSICPVLVPSQGITAEQYPSLAKKARKWSFRYFGELYAELLEVYLELQNPTSVPYKDQMTELAFNRVFGKRTVPSKAELLIKRYDEFIKAMDNHRNVLSRVCNLMDAIVVYITNLNPELASDYNLSNAPSDKVTPGKIQLITTKLNCIINTTRDQWIADMYGRLGSVMFKLRDEPDNSFYEHEKALALLKEEQKLYSIMKSNQSPS